MTTPESMHVTTATNRIDVSLKKSPVQVTITRKNALSVTLSKNVAIVLTRANTFTI